MDDADLDALASMRVDEIGRRIRTTPVLTFTGFLPASDHTRVLDDLLAAEPSFRSNRMIGRGALVLTDPAIVQPVIDRISQGFDEIIAMLDVLDVPTDGVTRDHLEPAITTSNGHSNYHGPHIDNDPFADVDAVISRRVTFVWHAFREPRTFTGGELRMWDHADVPSDRGPWTPVGSYVDHPCEDNTLLVFSSYALHEVLPVQMFGGGFADRRFAVVTAAHTA